MKHSTIQLVVAAVLRTPAHPQGLHVAWTQPYANL